MIGVAGVLVPAGSARGRTAPEAPPPTTLSHTVVASLTLRVVIEVAGVLVPAGSARGRTAPEAPPPTNLSHTVVAALTLRVVIGVAGMLVPAGSARGRTAPEAPPPTTLSHSVVTSLTLRVVIGIVRVPHRPLDDFPSLKRRAGSFASQFHQCKRCVTILGLCGQESALRMEILGMDTHLTSWVDDLFFKSDKFKGELLYNRGAVDLHKVGRLGAFGAVQGDSGHSYLVGVRYSDASTYGLRVSCECQRFENGDYCKHIWAMLLELNNYQLDDELDYVTTLDIDPRYMHCGPPVPMRLNFESLLRADIGGNNKSAKLKKKTVKSLPLWQQKLRSITSGLSDSSIGAGVGFPTGIVHEFQHWFAVSLADFASSEPLSIYTYRARRKSDGTFGKPQLKALSPSEVPHVDDPNERQALTLLSQNSQATHSYRYYSNSTNRIQLQPSLLRITLEALAATGRLVWTMDASQYLNDPTTLSLDTVHEWTVQVNIQPYQSEDGKQKIQVVPTLVCEDHAKLDLSNVVGVSKDGVLLMADAMGMIQADQVSLVRSFQAAGTIEVPARNFAALMDQVASWHNVPLQLHKDLPVEYVEAVPQPCLHLSSPKNASRSLRAEVAMQYGDHRWDAQSSAMLHWDSKQKTLLRRDLDIEEMRLQQLPAELFDRADYSEEVYLSREKMPVVVSKLTGLGWQVTADGNVLRRATDFNIKVVSDSDWFDLDASADFDGQVVTLPELLKAKRKGQNFVVLGDGTHGILPSEWLAKFDALERVGDLAEDSIRFRRNQALLLDAMLAEQPEVSLDETFRTWCEKLNSFTGISPVTAPSSFTGTLREYQQLGLGWLNFLQDFQLGGCLADDMGLGKTIQVLSLLEQRRLQLANSSETKRPSLVVVPKGLIFNWIEEAFKFAPQLKVLNYTGTGRGDVREYVDDFDVIITTYGTVRNDAAKLREVAFDCIILDEAQAIKNPTSQAAKATRLMNGTHRLAMTGTPVENHLGDLFSIFDFLNPQMLGSVIGGVAGRVDMDDESLQQISKALRPFILRRTKQQVLTELPEKTEQTLYCEMGAKQKKLYSELREHYRQVILGKVNEVGLAKSKIHVLEALLRLRQTACDPRLLDAKCGVKGAKLELLMEQLEDVLEDQHKVLVFSQFTSLLSLLRKDIEQKGWDYEYLDGKTRKRAEPVNRFQEDPNCKLFLISLKAGGNGLNLTAADYVFILDPWWNPAVEAQAIDRAHRMGQTKSVSAYRMICRGTVEEKIVELQSSKRRLADAIVSQKQSLISELSSEDLRVLFE